MVRINNKQTYADYVSLALDQYSAIHGLIDEFGGRVKQFTQDTKTPDVWNIFFEMAKMQKEEFDAALKTYLEKQ